MFGFSRKRMKIRRSKVHLSDSTQGTRSPIRHTKRNNSSNNDADVMASNSSDDHDCECLSAAPEISNSTIGSSENWMVLSISGEKPMPRFNHAAAVIGNKMIVVGGESGTGPNRFTSSRASKPIWTRLSSLPFLPPPTSTNFGRNSFRYITVLRPPMPAIDPSNERGIQAQHFDTKN